MAQEVKIVLLCDRCETRTEAETTKMFGADGQAYEVDLCTKHEKDIDKALSPWVEIARRAGRAVPVARRQRAPRGSAPSQPPFNEDACRTWAKLQGLSVKDTGRLSPTTIKKWRDAGSPGA